MHVYRWDLDRTYLETDIGSMRGLLRTAFEKADEKRNVPGSAELLRGLAAYDTQARITILSGSPTQLRAVLEEKLALDGVRFDRLTLKDNLGHLKRGRLRAVMGQLGYKVPVLLTERIGLGPAVKETLFGDDTEVDAVIYAVYAGAIAGKVSPATLARVLEAGGAYPESVHAALSALERVGRSDAVEDIFIRVDRGVPLATFAMLGSAVTPIHSWYQAAILLVQRGRLGPEGLREVAKAVQRESQMGPESIGSLTQDMLRRGLIRRDVAASLFESDPESLPEHEAILRAVRHLGDAKIPSDSTSEPDYVGFLRAQRQRVR